MFPKYICSWLTFGFHGYRANDVSQLKDNVVAVDATYYLSRILEHEPLVTALGGLLAAEKNINDDLDKWKANDTTPFFIFDGCPVKGEDELAVKTGREANTGADGAWALYSSGEAVSAVQGFGYYSGMPTIHIPLTTASDVGSRCIPSEVTLPSLAVHSEEAQSPFFGAAFQGSRTGAHTLRSQGSHACLLTAFRLPISPRRSRTVVP